VKFDISMAWQRVAFAIGEARRTWFSHELGFVTHGNGVRADRISGKPCRMLKENVVDSLNPQTRR
jgi:hypothetical protein